jgi:hypothetical protein
MPSHSFCLAAATCALLFAGCAETGPQAGADVEAVDVPIAGDEIADATPDDVGDATEDAIPLDDGDADVEEEPPEAHVPTPGGYLYPCVEDDDCDSGFCIASPQGPVCTKTCSDSCDVIGWLCPQEITADGVLFLCQPSYPSLCDPCERNDDCVTASDHTPHRCIPVGDAGAFCGTLCAEDTDCPDGYGCSTVVDIDGAVSKQCVTADGSECQCSAAASASSASTVCSVTNADGSCTGLRSCVAEAGLSACDAPVPQPEICNGVDDNCNSLVDETFESTPCPRTNEFGTCDGVTLCDGVNGERCEATTPAPEVCDAVDNDCDGETDPVDTPGCTVYYADADGDGFGLEDNTLCLCAPAGSHTATEIGDCDDSKMLVNPGATETCNGVDDDCDGQVDAGTISGCSVFHADADGDGFGAPDDSACLCTPAAPYTTTDNTDCAPGDGAVSPAAAEICGDGTDNDCDGATDEAGAAGCTVYFADADADTFGDTTDFACLCAPQAPYVVVIGGDCNDDDPQLSPALPEACGDGIDNDCDGAIDEPNTEGCVVYYLDADSDGAGIIGDAQCLCAPTDPYDATAHGDCADDDPEINPGAVEVCDGWDNDCDGVVDNPNTDGCTEYYLDSDGDTFGVGEPLCLCAPLGAITAAGVGDCDDTDPSANPDAAEICNGKDDSCDGVTDEPGATGCSVFYTDVDDDTFGVDGTDVCLCAAVGDSTATTAGDCDDALAAVKPGATEVCDAADNNCDGAFDEGCGLPTLGWPTAGFDSRRTGHTMLTDVPNGVPSLAWSTTLPSGGWSIRNSPVTTTGGDVIVSAADGVYRLAQVDGAVLASATLPAEIYPYAGPTLRFGGTVVVGAGSHMTLLTSDLTVLWQTDLGSPLVSTPIVDPNGNIYVVSASALHRVGPDGVHEWAEPAANDADTPSHPAIGINGRIYFTTSDHRIMAIDPAKPAGERVVFSVQPGGGLLAEPVHGSVVLSEIATVYAAFGDTIYGLSIAGTTLFERDLSQVTRAGLAIHNTGYQCCNPVEFVWYSAAGSAPLLRSNIDLAASGGTGAVNKSDSARTSTPVFDRDGDVLIGTELGIRAFRQNQSNKWTWQPADVGAVEGGVVVDGGAVIFGDDNSTVYYGQ